MTYYELVNYLDSLTNKPEILDSDIKYINDKKISLYGPRYVRFINQVNYLMSERLYQLKERITDRLDGSYVNNEELILLLSPITDEIKYLEMLLAIKYIKDENKSEYRKSIIEENNKLLDSLLLYFEDEDRINTVNSHRLEEK